MLVPRGKQTPCPLPRMKYITCGSRVEACLRHCSPKKGCWWEPARTSPAVANTCVRMVVACALRGKAPRQLVGRTFLMTGLLSLYGHFSTPSFRHTFFSAVAHIPWRPRVVSGNMKATDDPWFLLRPLHVRCLQPLSRSAPKNGTQYVRNSPGCWLHSREARQSSTQGSLE